MQPVKSILVIAVLTVLTLQCRSQLVNPALPRLCYSCKGIQCQRTTSSNNTVLCSDKLDVCATIFEGFAVSERGCFLQLSLSAHAKCEATGAHLECQKCIGELCNGKGRADFNCIQCNGSEDSECNKSKAALQASQCDAPTAPNSYCYVRQNEQLNLQRGCALTVAEQAECLHSSQCSLCSPADEMDHVACNNYAFDSNTKSAAVTHQLLSLGVLAMLLLAHNLFN